MPAFCYGELTQGIHHLLCFCATVVAIENEHVVCLANAVVIAPVSGDVAYSAAYEIPTFDSFLVRGEESGYQCYIFICFGLMRLCGFVLYPVRRHVGACC